jgi:hypothetical protein
MTNQELIDILVEFDPCYDIKICAAENMLDTEISRVENDPDNYQIIIYHE